jgi:hypothetical protein
VAKQQGRDELLPFLPVSANRTCRNKSLRLKKKLNFCIFAISAGTLGENAQDWQRLEGGDRI